MNKKTENSTGGKIHDAYIGFPDIRSMVQAIYLTGNRIPEKIIQLSTLEETWYLTSAQYFNRVENTDHIARQCNWKIRHFNEPPQGVTINTQKLIMNQWRKLGIEERFKAVRSGKRPVFIVACENYRNAQEMLSFFQKSQSLGYYPRPLLLAADSEEHGFEFFWRIEGAQPPLQVLEHAQRVWWGPVPGLKYTVFDQWPFDSGFHDAYLDKLPDAVEADTVLLSIEKPHKLFLKSSRRFRYLLDIADVQPIQGTLAALFPPEKDIPPFKVSLRLTNNIPQRGMVRKIQSLESEIRAKQLILEDRKLVLENYIEYAPGSLVAIPSRVFFFVCGGNEMPNKIRQLIIDRMEEGDLDTLLYQRIQARELPGSLCDNPEDSVHIIIPKRTLDVTLRPSTVAIRLLSYNPQNTFIVLPEWQKYGLHIGIAEKKNLAFYPPVAPGNVAAQKLGRALCPEGSCHEYLMLLTESDAGRIHVTRIRLDAFSPLVDTVPWKCNVEVTELPELQSQVVKKTVNQFVDGIGDAISAAVNRELERRVSAVWLEFDKNVNAVENDIANLNAKQNSLYKEVKEALAEFERLVNTCRGIKDSYVAISKEVDALEVLNINIGDLSNKIAKLSQINTELLSRQKTLSELITAIQRHF